MFLPLLCYVMCMCMLGETKVHVLSSSDGRTNCGDAPPTLTPRRRCFFTVRPTACRMESPPSSPPGALPPDRVPGGCLAYPPSDIWTNCGDAPSTRDVGVVVVHVCVGACRWWCMFLVVVRVCWGEPSRRCASTVHLIVGWMVRQAIHRALCHPTEGPGG